MLKRPDDALPVGLSDFGCTVERGVGPAGEPVVLFALWLPTGEAQAAMTVDVALTIADELRDRAGALTIAHEMPPHAGN